MYVSQLDLAAYGVSEVDDIQPLGIHLGYTVEEMLGRIDIHTVWLELHLGEIVRVSWSHLALELYGETPVHAPVVRKLKSVRLHLQNLR